MTIEEQADAYIRERDERRDDRVPWSLTSDAYYRECLIELTKHDPGYIDNLRADDRRRDRAESVLAALFLVACAVAALRWWL